MHIINFDSPEQMQEYLASAAEQAHNSLHQAQRDITWGDHWVRFVDLDSSPKIVEFGYVFTERTALIQAMQGDLALDECADSVLQVQRSHRNNYLFGRAFSVLGPDGEIGVTHRAHVWPIEERLFHMAQDADWNIDRLGEVGRVLLEIAFRGMRAHIRSQA